MTATASARSYAIDASHSSVHFSVRHLMISKVRGTFDKMSGTIALGTSGNVPVGVAVSIDASSINTRDAQRDGHLVSPDFLDVANFPTIEFASSSIASRGGDEFTVTGQLTIHGTSKEISFPASVSGAGKDPWGNDRVAFEGTAKISRKDFGVVWNQALEAGGVAVGDEIDVTFDIESIPVA